LLLPEPSTETALLTAPFWCTKRVESAHFDWRWRERPALALLAWEPFRDPRTRLRSIGSESTEFNVRKKEATSETLVGTRKRQ
jgi:hypothetical protein